MLNLYLDFRVRVNFVIKLLEVEVLMVPTEAGDWLGWWVWVTIVRCVVGSRITVPSGRWVNLLWRGSLTLRNKIGGGGWREMCHLALEVERWGGRCR